MLTSAELNERIHNLPEAPPEIGEGTGKWVPYIGWFWRDVDFDAASYEFGIIPGQFKGFMENNKWDYGYTRPTTPEEWQDIRARIEALVLDPTPEKSEQVWQAVHNVGEELPQCCTAKNGSGIPGLWLRCIKSAGHDGDHEFCL